MPGTQPISGPSSTRWERAKEWAKKDLGNSYANKYRIWIVSKTPENPTNRQIKYGITKMALGYGAALTILGLAGWYGMGDLASRSQTVANLYGFVPEKTEQVQGDKSKEVAAKPPVKAEEEKPAHPEDKVYDISKEKIKIRSVEKLARKNYAESILKREDFATEKEYWMAVRKVTNALSSYNNEMQPGHDHFLRDTVSMVRLPNGKYITLPKPDGEFTDVWYKGKHKGSDKGDVILIPSVEKLREYMDKQTQASSSQPVSQTQTQSPAAPAQPAQTPQPAQPVQKPAPTATQPQQKRGLEIIPPAGQSAPSVPPKAYDLQIIPPQNSAAYAGPNSPGVQYASASNVAPVAEKKADWSVTQTQAFRDAYNDLAAKADAKLSANDLYFEVAKQFGLRA